MALPEDNLNYRHVSIVPPGYITNRAYNSDLQEEYFGWAIKGSATSDEVWSIKKTTYDANKQEDTTRLAHGVAWDDRATSSYE